MRRATPAVLLGTVALAAGGAWVLSGAGMPGGTPADPAAAADTAADPETRPGTRPGASAENDLDDVRAIAEGIAESDSTLPAAVRAWYTANGTSLLWAGAPPRRATDLREALDRARHEGVSAGALPTSGVESALDRLRAEEATDSMRARAELEASSALVRLADIHLRGAARADAADGEAPGADHVTHEAVTWRIRTDSAPGRAVLSDVSARGVHAALDSVRPLLPVYDRTVRALDTYRARRDTRGGWSAIDVSGDAPVVEPGEAAPVVRAVRNRLGGSLSERERSLATRGAARPEVLDADLAAAIAHFQRRHGIAVDSTVGPETVDAMNIPLDDRIAQLRLNLDRMRRLPRDFGERAVLVNVAGFELRVLEEHRPVMGMGVVVGRPEWRTRVFDDTIEHLVVNPYWHVPESIEAEEVLPRVREDPDYLADNRMSVVPAGDNFGEPVDPATIDWSEVDAAEMPWDFRQEPGPENSLGQIKFMFPNEYAIYLHDTPADELFRRNFRAFSHGCIRVERPWELARWLLRQGSGPDADTLAALRRSGERTRVELDAPTPVYLTYLTTWVDEDGRVAFHRDVYDRDEALGVLDGETP